MGDPKTTDAGTQPDYEPFVVQRRPQTWGNTVDGRLRRRLPAPAYRSLLAGYHGLRVLARRNPGRGRVLPNFVIIGSAKAGTTSLYSWLCDHPDVERARVKEIHYFSFYYFRGDDWYRHHFPLARDLAAHTRAHGRPMLTGEASPSYLMHADSPARMAALMPDVKLIVSLRDPVDRAYSQFHMRRRDGEEPIPDFMTAVALEDQSIDGGEARARTAEEISSIGRTYLLRGRYAEQLERWYGRFPREQIHVLSTDDLAADPQAALDRVHEFLGLSPRKAESLDAKYTSSYEPMPEQARDRLTDYFRPHNERLYELLGRDFGWQR